MTNDANNTPQHSQTKIFFSSGGMAFVAFACAISGFLYGINRMIELRDLPRITLILSYVSLIFPYLYCRHAALEGRTPTAEQLRNSAKFVPLVLVAGLLTIFLEAVFLLIPPNERFALISSEIVALIPFAFLGVGMYRKVSRGGEYAVQERQFKNKVLLPALRLALSLLRLDGRWLTRYSHSSEFLCPVC